MSAAGSFLGKNVLLIWRRLLVTMEENGIREAEKNTMNIIIMTMVIRDTKVIRATIIMSMAKKVIITTKDTKDITTSMVDIKNIIITMMVIIMNITMAKKVIKDMDTTKRDITIRVILLKDIMVSTNTMNSRKKNISTIIIMKVVITNTTVGIMKNMATRRVVSSTRVTSMVDTTITNMVKRVTMKREDIIMTTRIIMMKAVITSIIIIIMIMERKVATRTTSIGATRRDINKPNVCYVQSQLSH